MRFSINLTIYLVIGCLFFILPSEAQGKMKGGDWQIAVNQEGIKVYTREVEGSSMKATKSVLYIDAAKKQVAQTLRDVSTHKEWMSTIVTSKMLDKLSQNEFYAYYVADAPWPVSQRDIVSHYNIFTKNGGELYFDVKGAPEYIPEKDDIVRIPQATSSWRVIPQEGQRIKLIYRYHADPGGSIPSWLANQAVTDTPFETVKNLRNRLEN